MTEETSPASRILSRPTAWNPGLAFVDLMQHQIITGFRTDVQVVSLSAFIWRKSSTDFC